MTEVRWDLYPLVRQNETAQAWLQVQGNLQLAPKTIDAYGRSLNDFLAFCERHKIVPEDVTREYITLYVNDLATRPNPKGANILHLESGAGLANSTMQLRITVVRLFSEYLVEMQMNKTATAYTKPVHPLVGKRINEWEQVRPREQPKGLDGKTSEMVQFLFSYRGRRFSISYITNFLIPLLCHKAGIPDEDSRGAITSHRARATIASMLYNAKEPLDIFQLKEYLGHKHLSSTQSYLKVNPTKLAYQVAQAGYLEQNLATIEVLLDQDAVMSGKAAAGDDWKFYDLGHGLCANPFWADCPHRMACARCPYYRTKNSLKDQLLEGQANLVRMLEFVKLTDDERLLVTEGIELHQELLEKLADVPTPAGPTPRELQVQLQRERKMIPLKPSSAARSKPR